MPLPVLSQRIFGRRRGQKIPETAPKHDNKTAIRPFPLLRQKWTDFHNRRHYAKNEPETEE